MQKNVLLIIGFLLFWFTLDMTGFSIGSFNLVESAIPVEMIDVVWWFLFVVCFLFFIKKENYGKYALLIFLIIWGFIQYPMYFTRKGESLESYNNFFLNTHHIINPSNDFLIKDTYHIVLDILIAVSFIGVAIFIIHSSKIGRKTN